MSVCQNTSFTFRNCFCFRHRIKCNFIYLHLFTSDFFLRTARDRNSELHSSYHKGVSEWSAPLCSFTHEQLMIQSLYLVVQTEYGYCMGFGHGRTSTDDSCIICMNALMVSPPTKLAFPQVWLVPFASEWIHPYRPITGPKIGTCQGLYIATTAQLSTEH